MQVIDAHAHWFPQQWIDLLEKEGSCGGFAMGRNEKGYVTFAEEIPCWNKVVKDSSIRRD